MFFNSCPYISVFWILSYREALIIYGRNYIRNIRKAIVFNYIRKAGVLITYGTQKRNFSGKKVFCGHAQTQNKGCKYQKLHCSAKKGPCGHVHTQNKGCEYQKKHFRPKKGPCGHAHTQNKGCKYKKSHFSAGNYDPGCQSTV